MANVALRKGELSGSAEKRMSSIDFGEDVRAEKEAKHRLPLTSSSGDSDAPPPPRAPRGAPQMIPWMDLVRTIGVILVILSHCSGATRSKIDIVQFSEWFSANVYTSIMRPAVPFFFLVSGYLMLHRNEPHSVFFGKRLPKILIPLAFWTIYYIGWSKWFLHERMGWKEAVHTFFLELGSNHLWFLYAIVGCYLATPFLRAGFRTVEPIVALGCVFLWLVSDPFSHTLRQMTDLNPPWVKFLEFPHGYMGLYFAGGVFKMYPTLTQRQLWLTAAVYAISVTWIIVGTTRSLYVNREDFDVYAHQQSLFVAVQSLALFLLVRHVGEQPIITENHRLCKLLRQISEQSFGIYLMHISVVHFTSRHFFNHWGVHAGIAIWIQVFTVLFVCYWLSWAGKKVPLVREVLP